MNTVVIIVFDNEEDSYIGLKGLKELHHEGVITLFSQAIIKKDSEGEVSLIESKQRPALGMGVGMVTGGIIGLLGGPVGMFLGSYGGSLIGLLYDIDDVGVDVSFIDEVSNVLDKEKVALLADIDEKWTIPLDTVMIEANGMVFRKSRKEVNYTQISREVTSSKEELKKQKKNLNDAKDEDKKVIEKHIVTLENKIDFLIKRINTKKEKITVDYEEKIKALEKQIQVSNEENKEKLQIKINHLNKSYESNLNEINKWLKEIDYTKEIK